MTLDALPALRLFVPTWKYFAIEGIFEKWFLAKVCFANIFWRSKFPYAYKMKFYENCNIIIIFAFYELNEVYEVMHFSIYLVQVI